MPLRFRKINMDAYYDEVIASHSGPAFAGTSAGAAGAGHTYISTDEGGVCRIVNQPILLGVLGDGTSVAQWGPPKKEIRAENYNEPVKTGAVIIEPDGSWGTWVPEEGYIEGQGQKPAAKFGSDGICIEPGYTPGGVYYNVGDLTEHPSAPPGSAVTTAGTANPIALIEQALAALKAKQ